MAKVYPRLNISGSTLNYNCVNDNSDVKNPIMLTVWKKSLLFNCVGFTVFDAQGNLIYRVDIYVSGTDIVLMDGSGNPLFTIRRKKWRFGGDSTWMVYQGEQIDNPMYTATKNTNFLSRHKKCIAHVRGDRSYQIEGSFCRRCCRVYDDMGRQVAGIKQKEAPVRGVALGMDIFTLVVQPGLIDPPLAMAFVILLDQMYGTSSTSRRPQPFI